MGNFWTSLVASVYLFLGLLAGILQVIALIITSPVLVFLIYCLYKYLNPKGVTYST